MDAGNAVLSTRIRELSKPLEPIPTSLAPKLNRLNRMKSWRGPNGWEQSTYKGAAWQRASQSSNGGNKKFLYDGDNVVGDLDGGSVDTLYVSAGLDQNISLTTGGETYYYTQDGLGSVRTVTDSDGNVVNKYDYTPFGAPYTGNASTEDDNHNLLPGTNATVEQRYTYTGRERNPVSNTMFYRYRTYSPGAGRFVSRDLIGYSDRINIYSYIGNSPIINIDPMGESTSVGQMTAGLFGVKLTTLTATFNVSCPTQSASVSSVLTGFTGIGWEGVGFVVTNEDQNNTSVDDCCLADGRSGTVFHGELKSTMYKIAGIIVTIKTEVGSITQSVNCGCVAN